MTAEEKTKFEHEIDKEIELKNEQEELQRQAQQLAFDFSEVAKTPQGQRVLKGLLLLAPIDFSCFSSDTNRMAYLTGRHSIGLELRQFLKEHLTAELINAIENTEL